MPLKPIDFLLKKNTEPSFTPKHSLSLLSGRSQKIPGCPSLKIKTQYYLLYLCTWTVYITPNIPQSHIQCPLRHTRLDKYYMPWNYFKTSNKSGIHVKKWHRQSLGSSLDPIPRHILRSNLYFFPPQHPSVQKLPLTTSRDSPVIT